ncbi:hypothetical protein, partial [Aliarcobacter cryaerophilus]|uniref:hypothetical protein n=1 Tax=Aliarcobacter cryaerophilus TaxID=28198 RepID=UPI0021B5A204
AVTNKSTFDGAVGAYNTAVTNKSTFDGAVGAYNTAVTNKSTFDGAVGAYNTAVTNKSTFDDAVGAYNTAVISTQSDSNIDNMDTINNFDLAIDKLSLGFGTELLADNTVGLGVSNGVVSSFGENFEGDLNAKFNKIFDAMGASNTTAIFTDGTDAYILQNDGVAGLKDTDIIVKLAGINDLTNLDLSSIIIE